MKNTEQNILELWDNYKRYDMESENRTRRKERKTLKAFEAVIENFPKLMVGTKPQMQRT